MEAEGHLIAEDPKDIGDDTSSPMVGVMSGTGSEPGPSGNNTPGGFADETSNVRLERLGEISNIV